MVPLLLMAQLYGADPAAAASFFSPAALNARVSGCGRKASRPTISAFEASWFSGVWLKAGEPSLASTGDATRAPVWRFTKVPTWTAPIVFRISMEDDGRLRMIAKRLSGKGGYDPGDLKDQVDRTLTAQEQERVLKALASVQDVPTCPKNESLVIMDGTELILEKRQAGRYAVGQRDELQGEPLAQVGALLSALAGWDR